MFGVGNPTGVLRPCNIQGRPGYCNNVFFTKPFFPAGMIRAPYPYAVPTGKAPKTFRIFVFGESAAYGDPDPAYGFSRYLEVMLRDRFPAMRFEVINVSATAINSHVLLPMARELADHQPDLFIIYAGNNEVVGPFGPGTVLTRQGLSLPVIRASIEVRRTRIGQLLANLTSSGEKPQEWHGMEMFLDKQVREDSPLLKAVYGNFRENLEDMVRAGRNSGARVVISTVATNLKDCAPFASAHRDGLAPNELQAWSGLMQQGARLDAESNYRGALEMYLAASKIDDQFAELQFRIARDLWQSGDYDGARQRFIRAQDLDTLRFRADSRINETIRAVATASGADLVDAELIFDVQSAHNVSGTEFLYEHVHLNPQGNYLLATALLQRIAAKLPAEVQKGKHSPAALSQEDCEKLLALTPYDRSRMAGEILDRVMRPPFANQMNQREQIQRLNVQAQGPTETFEQTAERYEWALQQSPDDHLLHLNYGMLLYDRNREAATQQFRRARAYDDVPFVAPDGTLIQ
jgi:tetratricopeptide (TPR) repeat protein